MDLSIIIVNWNSKRYLGKCLKSITAHTSGLAQEIVVIDNASFDGTGEYLQRRFPQVLFIQSHRNQGFGRSNNEAFRHSRGSHLLFLNPDTEVTGPAVEILYRSLNRLPGAGVVGGRLLNSDLTVQTSCITAFPNITNQVFDAELLRRWFPRNRLWGIRALTENQGAPQKGRRRFGRLSDDYADGI